MCLWVRGEIVALRAADGFKNQNPNFRDQTQFYVIFGSPRTPMPALLASGDRWIYLSTYAMASPTVPDAEVQRVSFASSAVPITAVTVFKGRAQITRKVSFSAATKIGVHEVLDFPLVLLCFMGRPLMLLR